MLKMQSLREFLNDRLTAAAEEIFGAVERTIAEYREEIFRSKDLEISRLRMQLRLLKSESESDECVEAELLQQTHQYHHPPPSPPPPSAEQQHHPSSPAVAAPDLQQSEEEEDRDGEHPESSQIKQEQQGTDRQFWMDHDGEHYEGLESDFISAPSGLKTDVHGQALHFHPFIGNSSGDETRDKPYSCSVCEKRFSNCSHLAAHIRTHTGERPYKCEICSKTFITTSALNRHQTIHSEGKRFVCNYCGKSFKWMESLGRHLRSAHKKGDVSE